MQRIYTNAVALTTGTPASATNVPERATEISVEPAIGNAAVSSVVEKATGHVIRQFPSAASSPVTYPFHHKSENNQITPGDYAFAGTTGDSMLVTFFEQ